MATPILKKDEEKKNNNPDVLAQEELKKDPYLLSQDPYGPVYNLLKKEPETDYYDEQKRLEKMKRTNALGDAFRLLTDVVGYNKGATIQKRTPVDYQGQEDRLRQLVRSGKNRQREINLNVEMQKAKQRQEEIEKEKAGKEWEKRNQTQFEQQKELLGQRQENALGLLDQRQQNALEQIGARYKNQKSMAGYNQGQINARQNKLFDFREQERAAKSAMSGKGYDVYDDDGSVAATLDKGGIDKLVTAILSSNDPEISESYNVIVNKYGDGLAQEAQRRLFVQRWWNANDELSNFTRSLKKPVEGFKGTDTYNQNKGQVLTIQKKLGNSIDIIDREYDKIMTSTTDLNERYRRLYNLILASKKVTPEEAKAFASDIVFNN